MTLIMGYAHLSDDDFLLAFENTELDNPVFRHADHVRLAWALVNRFGCAGAEERLIAGIRRLALKSKAPEKFLYTTTIAWVRLVAAKSQSTHTKDFSSWIAQNPEFLNKSLLSKYYSPERLGSAEARQSWLEPDLLPLA